MSPKKPRPPEKRPPAPMALGSAAAIPIGRKSGDACARVDRVAEYLDGVLDPAAQDELLEHLADCQICQAALHGEVQLRDREDELRAAAAPAAGSTEGELATALSPALLAPAEPAQDGGSLDRARRRRAARWKIPAALAAMAAVAAAGLFVVRALPGSSPSTGSDPGSGAPPLQIALAAKRPFEARLSWGPAAAHRPYEAMRSSAAPLGEPISLEVRARLEKQKDCAGLAATALLAGDTATAERQYADPACAAADAQADRAALAVTLRNYDQALELCDAVLAEHPDHPVALWNRALALRGKKLGLSAANAFDLVAAVEKDEAWRTEAQKLASLARAELVRARASSTEVRQAGAAMIPDGPVIPLEVARAAPARARLRLQDAIRTATSIERIEALRPLARTLEGLAGQGLEQTLDDAKSKISPARNALVPMYVQLFRAQRIEDAAAFRSWEARAQALGATDLLLGAHYFVEPATDATVRLADTSGDPWLIGLTLNDVVAARITAGDSAGAKDQLQRLEKLCTEHALPYLCLMAQTQRAELAIDEYQPAVAMEAALQALELASSQGDFFYRTRALWFAGDAERKRRNESAAAGYLEEWALSVDDCEQKTRGYALVAVMAFSRHRFAEAQRLLSALPRDCAAKPTGALLTLRADLAAAGLPNDRAEWLEDLRRAQNDPAYPEAERMQWEYLSLRASLRGSSNARQQMRELIARAAKAEGSVAARVKIYSESSLVVDAARTKNWQDALDVASAARGIPAPKRCAVALATDNFQFAAAVISATGERSGLYYPDATPSDRASASASLTDALKGCDSVAVLALPNWRSNEPPLSPSIPWSFVLGPPRAEPAAGGSPLAERLVVVENPNPPAHLNLPPLTAIPRTGPAAIVLSGPRATIPQVANAAASSTILEFHAHTARVASSDAPAIALTDDPSGWALTAELVSQWQLTASPVVLLADCVGGVLAQYDHVAWGLPSAFRAAGASAVVATLVDIPDTQAAEFFVEVREALRRDRDVARVVARLRAEKIAHDESSWTKQVVVFQ